MLSGQLLTEWSGAERDARQRLFSISACGLRLGVLHWQCALGLTVREWSAMLSVVGCFGEPEHADQQRAFFVLLLRSISQLMASLLVSVLRFLAIPRPHRLKLCCENCAIRGASSVNCLKTPMTLKSLCGDIMPATMLLQLL